MSTILKIEHLSHRYSSNWAVRDLNLEIHQNGIVGLLGSNGAGKSTTMNIICGVLSQTEGKVLINGFDIREQPEEAKKHIGFLPQMPPLYMDFTIDEYLHYTAHLRAMEKSRIKAAVEEVKEKTGIGHFSSRLIKNLSGGYKQRVGIAQAVIHKPKLVVLDEPTNGLDPNQLIEARKLIREVAQEHAVLLSSHILSEIRLLCSDVIMIESGRMVFADSMDAFDNYLQPNSMLVTLENMPAESALLAIKGVTKTELLSNRQVRIYYEAGQNINESIVEASMKNHWRLMEISADKTLLDDTFKQLSAQSAQ